MVELQQRIQDKQSLVIRQIARDRAQQLSDYRFLDNPRVTPQALVQQLSTDCFAQCQPAEHYLAVQDTSELNFSAHQQRLNLNRPGLGVVGNNVDLGFFIHPTMLIHPVSQQILGFSNVQLWTRPIKRAKQRDQIYKKLSFEYKESVKWLRAAQQTMQAETIKRQSITITMVSDRESDAYEYFRQRPAQVQLLVRVRCDRLIRLSNQAQPDHSDQAPLTHSVPRKPLLLYALLLEQRVAGSFELNLEADPRHKRAARTALLELRWTRVELNAPKALKRIAGQQYQAQPVYAIEVREHPSTIPIGEDGVLWRLLTTHEIDSFQAAQQVVGWYKLRWLIELFFAALKGAGLKIEDSQLESGLALQRLALLAFPAALKVMQLQRGRMDDRSSCEKIFSLSEIRVLNELSHDLQGRTLKQCCCYPFGSMAWSAWVIARLGGWNGYASERPPGVRTYHLGLKRFEALMSGWNLAHQDV